MLEGLAPELSKMETLAVAGLVLAVVVVREVKDRLELLDVVTLAVVDELAVEEVFGRTTSTPIIPASACGTTWQWNKKMPGWLRVTRAESVTPASKAMLASLYGTPGNWNSEINWAS